MNVQLTIDDLPQGKKNCATCTYRGPGCARMQKRYPNGMVKSSVTGEIGGIIAGCVHYKGR